MTNAARPATPWTVRVAYDGSPLAPRLDAWCPVALVNDTCTTEVHRCVVIWEPGAIWADLGVLRWAVDFAHRMRLPLHVITPWRAGSRDIAHLDADGVPADALRHHHAAEQYLREHADGLAWTATLVEGSGEAIVARHTYDHDVVAISRVSDRQVESIVRRAKGLAVVVPPMSTAVTTCNAGSLGPAARRASQSPSPGRWLQPAVRGPHRLAGG